MSAKRIAIFNHGPGRQHGAALMVMLVILIIGAAAILVSALNSSSLQIERDKTTADALAQAKDALIGYAVSDANRPGELPCPDVDGDGQLTMNIDYGPGPLCKQFVGYLPWKTLGLPELRDGANSKLWYAVSQNFYAGNTVVLNSDTSGQLSVSGNQNLSNIAAIIFAPGVPLCGKSQTTNNVDQYLEAMSSVTATTAVVNTNSNDCNNVPYNDSLLTITADQILQPVEKRIAREAKSCLDNYAASSASKYPWAAPVTDTSYQGATNTYFGRVPAWPIPSPDTNVVSFLSALTNLQSALANYIASNNSTTRNALDNAGTALENIAKTVANNQPTQPVISSNTTSFAIKTGDKTQDLAKNPPQTTVQNVQNLLASTISSLQSDIGMLPVWPSGCVISSAPYWADWQRLAFYQVASGYQPSGSASCTPNTTCLTINGSGNTTAGNHNDYHAAVIVARRVITPQVRNNSTDWANPSNYLEGGNSTSGTPPPPTFVTYNSSDPNYATVNDLVLCLDGKGTNPGSVCP